MINKNNLYSVNSPYGPSVSAYVTFVRKNDALACIQAIDECWIENRILRYPSPIFLYLKILFFLILFLFFPSIYRASFGTTKYCTYFLRNLPCNNPDCMYLHELGGDDDSFTKDDIANGYDPLCHLPIIFKCSFIHHSCQETQFHRSNSSQIGQ